MDLAEAWHLLGVSPTDHLDAIRSAFRSQMLVVHPDHSDAPLAHQRTSSLADAYRMITASLAAARSGPDDAAGAVDSARSRGASRIADQTASDTITVTGPPTVAAAHLMAAADRFGELLLVDDSAGLMQAAIEFVDGPACHILMDLQGRAHDGTTDVFITIDSLEARAAPDLSAVTALIVEFLNTAG